MHAMEERRRLGYGDVPYDIALASPVVVAYESTLRPYLISRQRVRLEEFYNAIKFSKTSTETDIQRGYLCADTARALFSERLSFRLNFHWGFRNLSVKNPLEKIPAVNDTQSAEAAADLLTHLAQLVDEYLLRSDRRELLWKRAWREQEVACFFALPLLRSLGEIWVRLRTRQEQDEWMSTSAAYEAIKAAARAAHAAGHGDPVVAAQESARAAVEAIDACRHTRWRFVIRDPLFGDLEDPVLRPRARAEQILDEAIDLLGSMLNSSEFPPSINMERSRK